MTDQTESASEYADEDEQCSRCGLMGADANTGGWWVHQRCHEHVANAIRALEAKVREGNDALFQAGQAYGELGRGSAEHVARLRADRDRLAGEVERLEARHEYARKFDSLDVAQAEVARLTAELAEERQEVERARAEAKQRFDDAMRNGERARQAEVELAAAREDEARWRALVWYSVIQEGDAESRCWRTQLPRRSDDVGKDMDEWAQLDAARRAGGDES